MRLRGKVAAEMLLLGDVSSSGTDSMESIAEASPHWVWRLGEWRWSAAPRDGKTQRPKKPCEYAVWTDGASWALYEERRQPGTTASAGAWAGALRDRGMLPDGARPPVPGP